MFAMILRTEHTSQPGTEFSQDCSLSTRGPTIPTTRHITTAQVTTSDSSLDPIIRPISSFHLEKIPKPHGRKLGLLPVFPSRISTGHIPGRHFVGEFSGWSPRRWPSGRRALTALSNKIIFVPAQETNNICGFCFEKLGKASKTDWRSLVWGRWWRGLAYVHSPPFLSYECRWPVLVRPISFSYLTLSLCPVQFQKAT